MPRPTPTAHVLEAVALAGCALLAGCTSPAPQATGPTFLSALGREARSVALITVDTLRYDATGFSRAGNVETPAFDALARQGVVFENAHAHAVVTLPSHASILTGLYPFQHTIRDNAGFRLPAETWTLARYLRERGYRTAAFVSAFPLDRRFGLDAGFEVYDDAYEGYAPAGFTPPERPGDETVRRATEWWVSHAGQPRFLWVHTFTPHFPYEPPEPWRSRYENPYYGEAAAADAELRPLLERLLEETPRPIIVLTSDHGEGLGEHGERTHGLFAYEATLRVPLVLAAEGLLAPARVSFPARHVDLVPTLLDLLGAEIPHALPGRSLLRPPAGDPGCYFEALSAYLNRGWAPLRGRLEEGLKAIELPVAELYDLRQDPHETANLASRQPDRLRELLAPLPEGLGETARASLDAETLARLRSLGYAASDTPRRDGAWDPSRDPKNLVEIDALLEESLTRYQAGDVQGAVGTLREVLRRQPQMALAYTHLAFILTDQGRLGEAIEVLEEARARAIESEPLARKLALALARAGRAREAREVLAPYEASADPDTNSALGRIAAALGDVEEARRRFERALELDPTYPTGSMDLGILLLTQGRTAEARAALEEAVARDPYLAEAWNALGVVHSQRGELAQALAAWHRALEADPRLPDALYNVALAEAKRGRPELGLPYLERYAQLVEGEERRRAQRLAAEWRARSKP